VVPVLFDWSSAPVIFLFSGRIPLSSTLAIFGFAAPVSVCALGIFLSRSDSWGAGAHPFSLSGSHSSVSVLRAKALARFPPGVAHLGSWFLPAGLSLRSLFCFPRMLFSQCFGVLACCGSLFWSGVIYFAFCSRPCGVYSRIFSAGKTKTKQKTRLTQLLCCIISRWALFLLLLPCCLIFPSNRAHVGPFCFVAPIVELAASQCRRLCIYSPAPDPVSILRCCYFVL
jgi:hypothetical protein